MAEGQISAVGPIDFGRQFSPSSVGATAPQSRSVLFQGGTQKARPAAATEGGFHGVPVVHSEGRRTVPFQTNAAARTPRLVTAAAGRLPQATPSNANVSMVLFDLQSGIRRAQALLQSVASEVPSISSRMMVAKAYSLEVQAQQEITRLQTEGIGPTRVWYA